MSSLDASSPFRLNIPRFFVYSAFKSFGFGLFLAVWVVFLQRERGLNLTQAAVLDVTFFVAAALAEVPTGLVADRAGRRTSVIIGMALLGVGTLAWVLAPTLPLIMMAYISMGIGVTFLSGAEDALFYESMRRGGRATDYTRLVGRVGATMTGALALGSLAGGLVASRSLLLPFILAGVSYLLAMGVALTFHEPWEPADGQSRPSLRAALGQALSVLRDHPRLRAPLVYLAVVPLAALLLETLFVQPQALALGLPVAAVGVLVMALQLVNVAGSAWSDLIGRRVGMRVVLGVVPATVAVILILLAASQSLLAVVWIAAISFCTAIVRPLVLGRLQDQIEDGVRATVLSLQSLLGTALVAVAQPSLGWVADHSGLPAVYLMLAGVLVVALLFWRLLNPT